MKTANTEVKNPRLKVGSSEEAGGSQQDSVEYKENKAKRKPVFNQKPKDSVQKNEQKNSQIEVRNMKNMDPAKKEPSNHKRKFKRKTERRIEENGKQIRCRCRRFCRAPDLDFKDPQVIFKFLGHGEKDIFHTIKWLEEIHTNVERDWMKFLKESHNGVPPDKK